MQFLVGDKTRAERVMGEDMKILARIPWNSCLDMQMALEDKDRRKALVQYVVDQGLTEGKPMESFMGHICTYQFRNRLMSYQ
jgi:hypothetical protein